MALHLNQQYDPSLIYLTLTEVDGHHALVDQFGRRLAWVRELNPNLSYDAVAECTVKILLSRPGSKTPEKFVNKKSE